MNIPFSPPDITDLEIQEVANALRSGWITTGPRTKELEHQVAAYCGTERAVCLNSQTACAEMALHLLGVGPGDEVIVPAYTYTATASIVYHVGAKIVMVDCQKNSLEMNYDKVADAITTNTKAIIAVDLAGIPCDYDRLFAIVEEKRGSILDIVYGNCIFASHDDEGETIGLNDEQIQIVMEELETVIELMNKRTFEEFEVRVLFI